MILRKLRERNERLEREQKEKKEQLRLHNKSQELAMLIHGRLWIYGLKIQAIPEEITLEIKPPIKAILMTKDSTIAELEACLNEVNRALAELEAINKTIQA